MNPALPSTICYILRKGGMNPALPKNIRTNNIRRDGVDKEGRAG
jgi:hypothetical protein